MVILAEHFSRDENLRHSDKLRQLKWFIKAREDAHQKASKSAADHVTDFGIGMVEATAVERAAFESKLERYEAATAEALMENQKQLDLLNDRIESMLAQAHVLRDGRRVFKSEDGTWAIDELGNRLSADDIDLDSIPDGRPSAEKFLADLEQQSELLKEREDLLDFQDKLDDAREDFEEGGMSADDLDALDAELLDLMPGSARGFLPTSAEATPTAAKDHSPHMPSHGFLPEFDM